MDTLVFIAALVGLANLVAAMLAMYMGHTRSVAVFFVGSVAFFCFIAIAFYGTENCVRVFGSPSPGYCDSLKIAALVALAAADCCLVAGLVVWRRERSF